MLAAMSVSIRVRCLLAAMVGPNELINETEDVKRGVVDLSAAGHDAQKPEKP